MIYVNDWKIIVNKKSLYREIMEIFQYKSLKWNLMDVLLENVSSNRINHHYKGIESKKKI